MLQGSSTRSHYDSTQRSLKKTLLLLQQFGFAAGFGGGKSQQIQRSIARLMRYSVQTKLDSRFTAVSKIYRKRVAA
jgi:hypothetical protein